MDRFIKWQNMHCCELAQLIAVLFESNDPDVLRVATRLRDSGRCTLIKTERAQDACHTLSFVPIPPNPPFFPTTPFILYLLDFSQRDTFTGLSKMSFFIQSFTH